MDGIKTTATRKSYSLGSYECLLSLEGSGESFVEFRNRNTDVIESLPVQCIGDDGLPADTGRAPEMADLDRLALMYACYEQTGTALFASGALVSLAARMGKECGDTFSNWQILSIAKGAHERGLLAADALSTIGSTEAIA